MKRFAGTGLMIAVLAALAGYYFLVDLPAERREREEKDRQERVLVFRFEDVLRMAYDHGDTHVRAEKQNNVWHLTEPLKVKADAMALGTFLNQLEEARFTRVVEEDPKDLARYGLDSPRFRIQINTPELGDKTVLIGDAAPSGHNLYFKRADQKQVLLVPGFPDNWVKTVFHFRDKTILDYRTRDLTAFTLKQPETRVEMILEKDQWRLTEPVKAKGDSAAIEDLLNTIRQARITAFDEEDPKDLARYGLDRPALEFSARAGENTWTLWVGKESKPSSFYARRASTPNIFQIPKRVKEAVETPYLELIDKQVFNFQEADVARLEIRSGSETLRLTPVPGPPPAWKIESPIQAPADTSAVNSLLYDLKETRAEKFMTFGEPGNFGLAPPKKTLTLTLKDGRTLELALGNSNLEKNEWFASRRLDQAVFVLKKEQVDKLFRSLKDLRDRRLFTFSEKEADRIVLEYPQQRFELQRGQESWTLTRPESLGPLQPFIGNDVLWTLNKLRFERKVDALPEGTDAFKSPALSVSVFDQQKKLLAKLQVGGPVKGEKLRWARVEGRPGFYAVPDRLLTEIPHTLEKFRAALKESED